eukprot:5840912-Alexandrium_andersonii.AAC.1
MAPPIPPPAWSKLPQLQPNLTLMEFLNRAIEKEICPPSRRPDCWTLEEHDVADEARPREVMAATRL